ncbi:hypothetical protein [Rhodohalobacter sp.]|uniref:hypothetical protein n=1 Tax=Rhodohalobacter sp. TaxID=1974210 RepID=UPI002ACDB4F2|nr:hypothetical protein [Rhodohalobacter sp.]MDZ7756027.1 hypothetical protein [Rhodohalobacter sp.]
MQGKGNKQRIIPLGKTVVSYFERLHGKKNRTYMETEPTAMPSSLFSWLQADSGFMTRLFSYMVEKYLKKTSEVTQKSPHVLTA